MEQEADTIAIVGMGMRAPEADDIDSFWRLLEEKRDVTREIPKERFNRPSSRGVLYAALKSSHSVDFIRWRVHRFD